MKNILLVLLALISITACGSKTFHGVLTVYEPLAIKDIDGRAHALAAGGYEIRAKAYGQNKKIRIDINGSSRFGAAIISLPKAINFKTDDASAKIGAADLEQPWDLLIMKTLERKISRATDGRESCHAGPLGYREVRYQEQTTRDKYEGLITTQGTERVVAKIQIFSDPRHERIYLYQGLCL